MIVGNKSDLASSPSASPKENIPFIPCSARTGLNVGKVFTGLTHNILQKVKEGKIDP